MEFERAIYRVYERCMDGLREEQDSNGTANTRSCKFLEVLAVGLGIFLLFVLVFLHASFVGSPGCLREELMNSIGSVNNDGALLRSDQILYINIDPRYRPEKTLDIDERGDAGTASAVTMLSWRPLYDKSDSWLSFSPDGKHMRGFDQATPFIIHRPHANGNESTYLSTDKNTTNYTEPGYDYKFTFNSGLLLLSYEELMQHGFTTVNVTLQGSQCYGNSFSQSIIPIGGVDTVVVNALMYTFRESGHVFTGSGDYFRWSHGDIVPYRTAGEWLQFKLLILLYSVLAFFLLTTITALMVRILISSGVVLIFPVFWLLQWAGFAPLNLRVVAISYPWIGVPLEMIRGRNQSMMPFLIGHISRVVVYYFLYQATQLVFAVWFYNRDSPGQQELWIFGVMMVWEYYAMIYVRAKGSIALFPRAALALFLMYHLYYFSFPAGFHVLALVTMFFFLSAVMIHCIRVYELKDYERGYISLDQPRALYNSLPFPVWNGDLAPEYTLMMPVTNVSVGAYQAAIPALNPTAAGVSPAPGAGPGVAVQGPPSPLGGVANPLQAGNSGPVSPAGSRQSALAGGGSRSSSPSPSPSRDSVLIGTRDDNSPGSASIELGTMSSSQRGILSNVLGALRGSSSSGSGSGGGGGDGTGGNTAYSRLGQSSSHGGADEGSNV